MKQFYAGIFMSKDDLANVGVHYPVKLEYYKTESNFIKEKDKTRYGIEVIKTSYINEEIKVENSKITGITKDEKIVNQILDIMKKNEVTPVCAEYIVQDLLKEIG